MEDKVFSEKKTSLGRLSVPALTVAAFAVYISTPTINLLAVDFAKTFNVPTGIATMLFTANSSALAILALLMGFLAIRFKHRSLLLTGVLFVSISALGCFLAPNLLSLLFFFALEGAGTAMFSIMNGTIIGDNMPLSKKPKAISYITAGTLLSTIVGTLVIGLIANFSGWRMVFLILVLPISVIGLLLTFYGIPREPRRQQLSDKSAYLTNFKRVLSNRFAATALVGVMFGSATTFVLFAYAFYREHFSQPLGFIVVTNLVAVSIYIVGNLVAGRLVTRFGTKPLIVMGGLVTAGMATVFFFTNQLWLALTVNMFHAFFSAFPLTAGRCLVIDQIPSSRSTMISVAEVFGSVGDAIGSALSGLLLVLFSYQIMGIATGALSVCATLMFFLAKDPYKKSSQNTSSQIMGSITEKDKEKS
jgi:predicted MFS family arabinose efflux permease